MMPGRRLAAVAALALLAPVGLAACQSDPAVAAYVGQTEISDERVTGVVSALRTSYESELESELAGLAEQDLDEEQITEFRAQGREEIDNQLGDARNRVLLLLVLTEVSTQYAADDALDYPEPDQAGVAEQQDLPEDHPYVAVVADFNAVVGTVLQSQVAPGEPTEEDQREVYENIRVDGQPVDVPFEEVQQFLTEDVLAVPVGYRDLIVSMLEEVEVRVQPGYDLEYQVPVTIGGATSHLAVQISDPSSVRSED